MIEAHTLFIDYILDEEAAGLHTFTQGGLLRKRIMSAVREYGTPTEEVSFGRVRKCSDRHDMPPVESEAQTILAAESHYHCEGSVTVLLLDKSLQ